MNKDEILDVSKRCIKLRLQDARQLVGSYGLVSRVISNDGLQIDGRSDSIPSRINFDVIDGIVVDSNVG